MVVACGDDGIALFERIRYRRFDSSVFMYAFDLIELNGDDLRRESLEWRKAARPMSPAEVTAFTRRPGGAVACEASALFRSPP